MSHEKVSGYSDDIGMICLSPTEGKYSKDNSSKVDCIAEFDNQEEAEAFAEKWSRASNNKQLRHFMLEKHELDHPEYYRISGNLRKEYIDHYYGEWEKESNAESIQNY